MCAGYGGLAPFWSKDFVPDYRARRMIDVRPLEAADEAVAATLLDTELGGRHQARLGEVHDVLELPGLGPWEAERLVGVATYDVRTVPARARGARRVEPNTGSRATAAA